MSKKSKIKKSKSLKDYYDSIDFDVWWDEFFTLHSKNGTLLYPTVWSFVKEKAKSGYHRRFLWWILGPRANKPDIKEFSSFRQKDWDSKRERRAPKETTKITEEINRSFSSLDELRSLGKINLDQIVRIVGLISQLDLEYGGQLNLPNLSYKLNTHRVSSYLRQREALLDQLHSAQLMFAKTRGVDFANLDSILAMIGPSVLGKAAQGIEETDPKKQAAIDSMQKVTLMLTKKCSTYDMRLPDTDAEKIIRDSGKTITIPKSKLN
jgi:hypothetical protein